MRAGAALRRVRARVALAGLCAVAMGLPIVLSVGIVPPPIHDTSPLQTALVVLFNAGYLGLAALGLDVAAQPTIIET